MSLDAPLLLLYATHDGQTGRVAAYLKERLEEQDVLALAVNLAETTPSLLLLEEAPRVIVISPIRYGRHLPAVERFLRAHQNSLDPKTLGMISINLTARKEGKNTPETNPYYRKWVKKHGIIPALRAVWAGKLDYPRYRWWDRQMIRLIMKITGGATNPREAVDYTPWDQITALAQTLAQALKNQRVA